MRSDLLLSPETLLAVLYGLTCFVAGVAFAAYRAVGWVERMRTWAASCSIPTNESKD